MTMLPVWPVCTLTPRDVLATPMLGSTRSGGRNLAGGLRTASWSAGGLWRMSYERIHVRTRAQILAAQALEGILDGGAAAIIVPRLPGLLSPDARAGLTPFSDTTLYADGAAHASVGSGAYVATDADMSATTIVLDRPGDAQALIGGEDFELRNSYGPAMHRVIRILDQVIVGAVVRYTLEIRTPLREAATAGQEVFWIDPRCVMRLTNAAELSLMLRYRRFGEFSAQFVEA